MVGSGEGPGAAGPDAVRRESVSSAADEGFRRRAAGDKRVRWDPVACRLSLVGAAWCRLCDGPDGETLFCSEVILEQADCRDRKCHGLASGEARV